MSLLRAPLNFADFKAISLPLADDAVAEMRAGDLVLLTGTLYTGRDQTHRRLCALLDEGASCRWTCAASCSTMSGPARPGQGRVIGAAGPTTSYRMDAYTPTAAGTRPEGHPGQGGQVLPVREAMRRHGAVYLAAFGGAGALLAQCIKAVELVAFADAGPEAMFRFEVRDFPAVVINDVTGRDFYEEIAAQKK